MNWAVVLFLIFAAMAVLFQIVLLAGAPFGHLTMGGFHRGVLPLKIRRMVAVSAILLVLCGLVVLTRAGWIFAAWLSVSRVLIWVVVGYLGLGVVMNTLTPSRWERIIWLPQVVVLFSCALLVALG
jgi:hypothetical protein